MEIRVQNTAKMTLNITDPRQLLNQFMAVILSLYIALFCVFNPPNLPVFSTKYDGVNVNALTDVNLSAKGDLLLQGGEYNVGGNVGLDIGGKVYLQGTVDTQYSFSHVNDNNGFTITDTTKVNQTQVAHMPSMVVGGTNGIALSDKVVLGGKNEDGSVGLTHEGAWVGAGTLAGLFPKEGGDKGSGGGKDPYAGDTTTQVASINPEGVGYEYLKAINDNTNTVDGKAVNLTTINYKEQTVQLGTIGNLALQLAVNSIMPGLGLAGWQAAVVSSMLTDVGAGVITGDLDMENLLRNAAFAGVSSFVGGQLNKFLGEAGLSQVSPIHAENGLLSDYNIVSGLSTTVVNAGLTSAIYGTDFGDNLSSGLQGFVFNQALAVTHFGIGEIRGDEGSFVGTMLHTGVGCMASQSMGGSCAAGAASAFMTDYTTGVMHRNGASDEQIKQAAAVFNPLFSTLTSGGSTTQAGINSGISGSITENNYLNHGQRVQAEKLAELKDQYCSGDGFNLGMCAKVNAAMSELADISDANTAAMLDACRESMSSTSCQAHIAEMKDYVDWANDKSGRSIYNVEIGLYYHDNLVNKGVANLDQNLINAIGDNPILLSYGGDSLDKYDETIHSYNKIGLTGGYLFEADRLQNQGALLDQYEGLNNSNDPLVKSVCYGNDEGSGTTCYTNKRTAIEAELSMYGLAEFVIPSTAGGVIVEIAGFGLGKIVNIGGKTLAKVGDEYVEVVSDGAGGFKAFKSTDTKYSVNKQTYDGSDAVTLEISGNPEPYTNAQLTGTYSDGNLRIDFYSTDVTGQNIGTELISNAIDTVGSNNVSTVSGQFGLTNRTVYDNAITSGSSPTAAAWSTPLGKSMSELGFTSVEVSSGYNPTFVFGMN